MSKSLIFTLFGSTGDLAQRKVMPALFQLFLDDLLPKEFTVIAFSRRPWKNAEYRSYIRPFLEKFSRADKLDAFLEHVIYAEGHFKDPGAFVNLKQQIKDIEADIGTSQQLYFFAVQPEFFESIIGCLDHAKIFNERSKVLIEKPFGLDLASAQKLEKLLTHHLKDEQIYRIDHYLAKDGFQNLIKERMDNKNFEKKLSGDQVKKVTALISESIGIEGRGEFYDKTGAIIDVGQNHLLQMLATALMDLGDRDRNHARAEIISSLRIIGEPVLAQYAGYLEEEDVPELSTTETYFSAITESTLARWKGVEIELIAGKALDHKESSIKIEFIDGTVYFADMGFSNKGRDAYEVVLEHAIAGEKAYFASLDEIVASWQFFEPILKKRGRLVLKKYPKGSNAKSL